ncbi:hypothetical protein FACS1894182_06540 [Bacteroidia bacterium]|nr:hypothetical protein FACS1894182_06540 [Bacteroidia bacterium]
MYLKFTQNDSGEYCNVMENETLFRSLNPQKETLALIMQFARVYHVEKKLPGRLSELILN